MMNMSIDNLSKSGRIIFISIKESTNSTPTRILLDIVYPR